MAKLGDILRWGWQGINVWSVLLSIGAPSMVLGILHAWFDGWAWYYLLLTFGGAALVILGVLVFFHNKGRDGRAEVHKDAADKGERIIDSLGWMPSKVEDQTHNPARYVYSRLIKVFQSSPTEIGFVVEWFNCSAYDLRIESAGGEVWMARIGYGPASLGHQVSLDRPSTIPMFSSATCTLYLQVVDANQLEEFKQAIRNRIALAWNVNLTWQLSTGGYARPFSTQTAITEGINMVPFGG